MNVKITRISICVALFAAGFAAAFFCTRYDDYRRYTRDTGLSRAEAVKIYGKPNAGTEWLMSLANAAADENWNLLDRLTQKDRHSETGSYYRNLAKAMKGGLADNLFSYYAPFERALFVPVGEKSGRFTIAQSGEVWYQLGEMTMAEHSAILGLIFSDKQNGRRFTHRLGEINRIWGDEAAADKYFKLAGKGSSLSDKELAHKRSLMPSTDTIHSADNYRAALKALVAANPANTAAYEYLLCLDLLCKDLASFEADFDPSRPAARIYQQAGLIIMASTGDHSDTTMQHYGISSDVFDEFQQFSSMFGHVTFEEMQRRFGTTYWFYYKYARKNENGN